MEKYCPKCLWEGPEYETLTQRETGQRFCPEPNCSSYVLDVKYGPEIDRIFWQYSRMEKWTREEWEAMAAACLLEGGWKIEKIREALGDKPF